MESNLKARAFAAYLGSEYLVTTNIEGNPVIDIVTPQVLVDLNPEIEEGRELLLLIPLSKITEADAIEVAKLSGSDTCTDYTLSTDGVFIYHDGILKYRIWFYDDGIGMDISKNGIWHDCTTYSSFLWRIADYLRSKSYNLPFMGYDLLKEGIATLKTK